MLDIIFKILKTSAMTTTGHRQNEHLTYRNRNPISNAGLAARIFEMLKLICLKLRVSLSAWREHRSQAV